MSKWVARMIEAAIITITIAAVCQELEKPKEERRWHGRVGFMPYDFRLPTMERLKESFWNPSNNQIFTTPAFGIGWAINLFTLMEKMELIVELDATEEDFLMPTPSLKEVLENRPAIM